MSSPPFPFLPPFKFCDLKKYLHLDMNSYSMKRENTDNNIRYENMTDIERLKEIEEIKRQLFDKSYIILPNKYPYWLEEGLIHKIIWVNNKSKKKVIPEEIAINHLIEKGYKDFVIFCNSRDTKSVPSITHYHVIYMLS